MIFTNVLFKNKMKFEENNFDVENLRAEPQFKKHFR